MEFAEFLQATAELAWLAKDPLSQRGPKSQHGSGVSVK